jgi:hypothetical protein
MTKTGGAVVLAVVERQQVAKFGADLGIAGRLLAVAMDKCLSCCCLGMGQQVADANGDEAAGIAVHMVDAAFLLFQLAHQGGNKGS